MTKTPTLDPPILYPKIGGIYKHYKGGMYEVLLMATDSETDEPVVVYKSLLFGSHHTRPLKSWNEKVKGTRTYGGHMETNPLRFSLA